MFKATGGPYGSISMFSPSAWIFKDFSWYEFTEPELFWPKSYLAKLLLSSVILQRQNCLRCRRGVWNSSFCCFWKRAHRRVPTTATCRFQNHIFLKLSFVRQQASSTWWSRLSLESEAPARTSLLLLISPCLSPLLSFTGDAESDDVHGNEANDDD